MIPRSKSPARRSLRALLAIAGAAIALAMGNPARASDPDRRALRDEARVAYRAGDVERACVALRRVVDLERSPAALADLGDCEDRAGRPLAAHAAFQESASHAGGALAVLVRGRLAGVESKLARIRFDPSASAPVDVRVVTNEGATIALGADRWVAPGELVATLEAPNARSRPLRVALAAGDRKTIVLGPMETFVGPPPVAPSTPGTPTIVATGGSSWARSTGWVLLGLGVASVAVGATTGIGALHDASVVARECDDVYRCSRVGVDAGREGSTFSMVATASLVAGGAAIVIGTTLLVLGRRREVPAWVTTGAVTGMRGTF